MVVVIVAVVLITFLPEGVSTSVICDISEGLVSNRYGRLIVSNDAPIMALVWYIKSFYNDK